MPEGVAAVRVIEGCSPQSLPLDTLPLAGLPM